MKWDKLQNGIKVNSEEHKIEIIDMKPRQQRKAAEYEWGCKEGKHKI